MSTDEDERKLLIMKLMLLEKHGYNVDGNYNQSDIDIQELKYMYESTIRHRTYGKLDGLKKLGYLPDYDHSRSVEELEDLYKNILVTRDIFTELCSSRNLPLMHLYNHIHYPVFLYTPSSSGNAKTIANYFNMVFETNITMEQVTMVMMIIATKSLMNKVLQ
jgi:hypothetical protein